MPPGHARDALVPYRFSKREKWIVGGVVSLVAALIVVVALSLVTGGHSSGNGCVNFGLPSTLGGSEIYRCGEEAQALCGTVGKHEGVTGTTGKVLAAECRKAGIVVG
jgi:hypothetical protein